MFIVLAYIKFLLRSTNQHGVHSPFVYGLVTRCFYDKKKYPFYSLLKQFRKSLLKDKREIRVEDFGAGSRVFKSDKRKVSKMAKNAGISPKRARLLNRLVRYLEVESALELGTSLGLGTAAMAAGNKVKVTTIEGCSETAAIAGEKFEEFGLNNIQLKVGEFEDFLVDGGQRTEDGGIQDLKFKIQDFTSTSTGNRKQATGNEPSFAEAAEDRQQERISNIQDPNSKKTQLTTDNSQPTTDNSDRNSKFQIFTRRSRGEGGPNSKSPAGADLQSVTNTTSNSRIRNPNSSNTHNRSSFAEASEDKQLTTNNSQPTTPNSELITHSLDLLYIDGHHQKEATLSYFEKLLPTVNNDSVMIFDDIHWSKGMEEAWEEIKNHPQVRVTIDTFQWGMVFFRREQEKEHFVIRI